MAFKLHDICKISVLFRITAHFFSVIKINCKKVFKRNELNISVSYIIIKHFISILRQNDCKC